MEISKFRSVVGDSPAMRIIEYLILWEDMDFSLTDIAEGAEVSWSSLHRVWKNLEKLNLIRPTRVIGNAKLFTLNKENSIAFALINLFNQTIGTEERIPIPA